MLELLPEASVVAPGYAGVSPAGAAEAAVLSVVAAADEAAGVAYATD